MLRPSVTAPTPSALARKRPPDLLVTDVMMPELDGFELLAELRDTPETRELPVIMLSARAGEEASIEGLEAGADDYLPKPFSGRELLARVRAHLELSLVRRQASEDIRAERLLLEQTLTQLPAGVIVAEAPSGRIVLANQQVPEILGHDLIEPHIIEDYSAYHTFAVDKEPVPAERRASSARSGTARSSTTRKCSTRPARDGGSPSGSVPRRSATGPAGQWPAWSSSRTSANACAVNGSWPPSATSWP